MNRNTAKQIEPNITNEQILQMFNNAKAKIIDWTRTSNVNKGLTKGSAWNVLAENFDVNKRYHPIARKNMIWEFGDFLPKDAIPQKEAKEAKIKPIHQTPKFMELDAKINEIGGQNGR